MVDESTYNIDNIKFVSKTYALLLGLTIDQMLDWRIHIDGLTHELAKLFSASFGK